MEQPPAGRSRRIAALLCGTLATFHYTTVAAPGDLDLTFGGTGKVTTTFGDNSNAQGNGVALQSDGKIVVAGSSIVNGISYDLAVVRYTANGSLDTTFNGSGKVITDLGNENGGNGIAIQRHGKIVVAGWSYVAGNQDFAVVRYNADGSLDTTFNGTGQVTTAIGSSGDQGNGVALQDDGKIVVAGISRVGNTEDFAVIRYNADGSLDPTFNGTGKVTTPVGGRDDYAWSVTLQNDGKIVVAGSADRGADSLPNKDFAVVRYNSNGSLDTTFNDSGKATTECGNTNDVALSAAVQADGKIVVAGGAGNAFEIVRYNADGSLDGSFNGTGKINTAIGIVSGANSVALQRDGKIIVAGSSSIGNGNDFTLARYNPNGSLDTSFDGTGTGIVTTDIGGVADQVASVVVQNDGRIMVAGSSAIGGFGVFAVARYGGPDTDGDGIVDAFETETGIYVSAENTGSNPTNSDTDGDGLNDGVEVNTHHSNPNDVDTDADGFEDGFEVATGFSPTSAASTPDALSSIRTAAEYRFNAAKGISYRIEASFDLVNWTSLETDIVGAGGVITRFYSIEGEPKRFFRSRRN